MLDRGTITEQPAAANGETAAENPPSKRPEMLEERVRRLEDALVVLQDTRHLEERVVERVTSRLSRSAPPAGAEPTGIVVHPGRRLVPAALNVAATREQPTESPGATSVRGLSQSWLLLDFYNEVRAMVRMFFDRRYRVAWLARVVPVVALTLFLFSWFFIHSIPWIGPILDRLVEIVLICIVYKVLSREAQRYRQAVCDLPPLHRV
jgi:hypothetical protein